MNVKLELFSKVISDAISSSIKYIDIDVDKSINSLAINALNEIQQVIVNNDYSDFEAIEAIVCVLEKYNIDTGGRHDF